MSKVDALRAVQLDMIEHPDTFKDIDAPGRSSSENRCRRLQYGTFSGVLGRVYNQRGLAIALTSDDPVKGGPLLCTIIVNLWFFEYLWQSVG